MAEETGVWMCDPHPIFAKGVQAILHKKAAAKFLKWRGYANSLDALNILLEVQDAADLDGILLLDKRLGTNGILAWIKNPPVSLSSFNIVIWGEGFSAHRIGELGPQLGKPRVGSIGGRDRHAPQMTRPGPRRKRLRAGR